MSFSSAPRRGQSGTGRRMAKSTKKKKQEFHKSKRRVAEEEKADLEAVKSRTISALEHLGAQRFSAEPGGYNLQGWVKSLSLLLDDFEAKVDAGDIPPVYFAKKGEIVTSFSGSMEDSVMKARVEELRNEEVELQRRLDRERESVAGRTVEVRNESERHTKAIGSEKEKLAQLVSERESVSFLSRVFGRRGPPTKPTEDRIEELVTELRALESEAVGLEHARSSLERHASAQQKDPYEGEWKRLDEIAAQISQLEKESLEKMQREEERALACGQMVQIIKGIVAKVGSESTGESAA